MPDKNLTPAPTPKQANSQAKRFALVYSNACNLESIRAEMRASGIL